MSSRRRDKHKWSIPSVWRQMTRLFLVLLRRHFSLSLCVFVGEHESAWEKKSSVILPSLQSLLLLIGRGTRKMRKAKILSRISQQEEHDLALAGWQACRQKTRRRRKKRKPQQELFYFVYTRRQTSSCPSRFFFFLLFRWMCKLRHADTNVKRKETAKRANETEREKKMKDERQRARALQ